MKPRWLHAASHFDGAGVEHGIDFTVIKRHLKHYESRGMNDRYAALLTIAAGACWTRKRKFDNDLVSAAVCALCNADRPLDGDDALDDGDDALAYCGDSLCFFWRCPKLRALESGPAKDAVEATKHLEKDAGGTPCFWLRGLAPKGAYPVVPDPEENFVYKRTGAENLFLSGSVFYLDGSGGVHTGDARLRRCGWAACVVAFGEGSDARLLAAEFGPLHGFPQTVPRSELLAAVHVMRRVDAATSVFSVSDC